jgi:hypothetical protein
MLKTPYYPVANTPTACASTWHLVGILVCLYGIYSFMQYCFALKRLTTNVNALKKPFKNSSMHKDKDNSGMYDDIMHSSTNRLQLIRRSVQGFALTLRKTTNPEM